jgi:RecA-family ATPase
MNLIQTSKEYRDKYNFSVFPVVLSHKIDKEGFDKKPAVTWLPFTDRLPTDDEIESGFNKSGVNAIGLVTGKISGITVLDWDGKEECPYQSPVMVKTISGGKHTYFKYKEGVKNTVRVGGKELDVRGEHGFVVIPPSELDGQAYTWKINGDLGDLLKNLPEFPQLEEISKGNFAPTLDIRDSLNVSIGERDDRLYRLACSLLQKHLPEEAWELILASARTYEGFGHSFTEADAKAKYQNAYDFLRQRGNLYIQRGYSSVDTEARSTLIEKKNITIDFEPKLLSSLEKDNYKVEWLWDGFLAKGHITLLSALWKAGKTTLLAELFRCMQEETALAGQKTHKCQVLYLSEERETQWVLRREEKNLTLPIHILCNPLKRKLKYDEWVVWVEKAANFCVEKDLSLAVIDTMTTFSSVTDENDSSQVNAALLPLNYFREKNIAVLLVHHFRKSGGNEGTASRGSGALMSYVDVIMEFSRQEPEDSNNNQRKLISLSRFDETPTEIILDYVDNQYSSQVITSSKEAKKQNKSKKVFGLINKLISNGTIGSLFTIVDIHENWDDSILQRPAERTIRNYLEDLISMKKILFSGEKRKVGKTEAKLYKVIDDGNTTNPLDSSVENTFEVAKEIFGVTESKIQQNLQL